MAKGKNEAKINLKVDDNGSLKDTGKKAKQAGKDMEKGAKGAHSMDRRVRGAAKMSSGASKNFSKMSQGISGGLVPAYATLAASLFALDAAFRFLKEAGDLRILQEGQLKYAQLTGTAFSTLTKDLREATEGQISFKDAAQAVAIGTAAGLTAYQLNELGTAAKNLSLILGRDVVDSFNRLIRGTTKAEPELLDELGIILRLEKALTTYANKLGVAKESLNAFQRTQAVTNEVLRQASEKAQDLDLNVSEFNKLGVAFTDLIDRLQVFISGPGEWIAKVLSQNILAATGVLLLFGTSLLKSILPSLGEWKKRQKEASDEAEKGYNKATRALAKYNNELHKPGKRGAMTSTKALGKLNLAGAVGTAAGKGEIPSKRATQAALRSMENKQGAFYKSIRKGEEADVKRHLKTILNSHNKTQVKIRTGIDRTKFHWQRSMKWIETKWRGMHLRMTSIASGFATAMGVVMSAIGYISMIMMVVGIIKTIMQYRKDEGLKAYEEKMKKTAERSKDLNKNLRNMTVELKNNKEMAQDAARSLEYLGNVIGSFNLEQMRGAFTGMQEQTFATDIRWETGMQHTRGGLGLWGPNRGMQKKRGGPENKILAWMQNMLGTANQAAIASDEMAKSYKGLLTVLQAGGKITDEQVEPFVELIQRVEDITEISDKAEAKANILEILGLIKEGGSIDVTLTQIAEAAAGVKALQKSIESYSKIRAKGSQAIIGTLFRGQESGMLQATRQTLQSIQKVKGTRATDPFYKMEEEEGKQVKKLDKVGLAFEAAFGAGALEGLNTYGDLLNYITRSEEELWAIQKGQVDNKISMKDVDIKLAGLANDKTMLGAKLKTQFRVEQMIYALANKQILVDQAKKDLQVLVEAKKKEGDIDYDKAVRALDLSEREVILLRLKKKALEDTIKPLKQIEEAAKQTFEKGMSDAIMGVIDGTQSMKEGFLNMAKAVLTAIAQIIAQLIAMKILQAATSFFGGGMAEGGVIPKAAGGYIGTGKKPRGYRTGGVVTEPTYLVGEGTYNEAVVPLPDGRSIPVVMKGGGASNVVVNVNVASDGEATSNLTSNGGHEAAQLGRAISVAVTEELYKQKRPGGALSPYGGG